MGGRFWKLIRRANNVDFSRGGSRLCLWPPLRCDLSKGKSRPASSHNLILPRKYFNGKGTAAAPELVHLRTARCLDGMPFQHVTCMGICLHCGRNRETLPLNIPKLGKGEARKVGATTLRKRGPKIDDPNAKMWRCFQHRTFLGDSRPRTQPTQRHSVRAVHTHTQTPIPQVKYYLVWLHAFVYEYTNEGKVHLPRESAAGRSAKSQAFMEGTCFASHEGHQPPTCVVEMHQNSQEPM